MNFHENVEICNHTNNRKEIKFKLIILREMETFVKSIENMKRRMN